MGHFGHIFCRYPDGNIDTYSTVTISREILALEILSQVSLAIFNLFSSHRPMTYIYFDGQYMIVLIKMQYRHFQNAQYS